MERSSRRHEGPAHLVHVALERQSTMPISRQLYLQLRQAIVSGQIPAAARLPSTRAATKLWAVSRGSVVEAAASVAPMRRLHPGFMSVDLITG